MIKLFLWISFNVSFDSEPVWKSGPMVSVFKLLCHLNKKRVPVSLHNICLQNVSHYLKRMGRLFFPGSEKSLILKKKI